MKILVINGPNLNLLGKRDPAKYGTVTLAQINEMLVKTARSNNIDLTFFKSNHEGAIIDFLQMDSSRTSNGVLINPGALVRYGWCLRQALVDLGKPIVEVHMSNINKTGVNKSVNILEDIRTDLVVGFKEKSYIRGLEKIYSILQQ